MIFKCKMCGGDLEIREGSSVAECLYCGSTQTLPRLDDERRANLYDRANHFRRGNEFDKAMSIYEQILNEEPTDAEAYWSLVLCRYGIEYVEDPATRRRVPTVNRAQYTSVFDDDNYKAALNYADGHQKAIYEAEAKAINEIQKGILAISQNEEPFDVFICYKETDNNGRRTPDSVLANDLYHQLTQEGFKVFFSRITLEDKLGREYEPYIFAALNSAKVMVVLGTKPEYFKAVWVKNEWSRFLSLIKNGAKDKVLVPAYKDMDPYDLPDEFSHLQAQDMSKLGFMQDLIRGIKKLTGSSSAPQTEHASVQVNASEDALYKRGLISLEDGEWPIANTYFERLLDLNPENAHAYIGKFLASHKLHNEAAIAELEELISDDVNFTRGLRYADTSYKAVLEGYLERIQSNIAERKRRLEELERQQREEAILKEKQRIYDTAVQIMESPSKPSDYEKAADIFKSLGSFKDAEERIAVCKNKYTEIIYQKAVDEMQRAKTSHEYWRIKFSFKSLSDYKDSALLYVECERQEELLRGKEDRSTQNYKNRKKITLGVVALVFISFVLISVLAYVSIHNGILEQAKYYIENGSYFQARDLLIDLAEKEYKNASELLDELRFNKAVEMYEQGYEVDASILLQKISSKYESEHEEVAALKEEINRLSPLDISYLDDLVSGLYIYFGNYLGDDLHWKVDPQEDGTYKLIYFSSIDNINMPFRIDSGEWSWSASYIRQWLNGDFYSSAFSEEERALMTITELPLNAYGEITEDIVRVVSREEAKANYISGYYWIIPEEEDSYLFYLGNSDDEFFYEGVSDLAEYGYCYAGENEDGYSGVVPVITLDLSAFGLNYSGTDPYSY